MKIDKQSLALYSLFLIREDDRGREYHSEHVANAMGISPNTLDLYISRLVKKGYIIKQKKRYLKDLNQTVSFTQEGLEEVERIRGQVNALLLTTDRHNIPKIIKVIVILDRIRDPLEKVFFLLLYHKVRSFDLPMYLNTLRMAKMDINLVDIFSDMDVGSEEKVTLPFVESFYSTSLWGKIDAELPLDDVWRENYTNTLLLLAEAYLRQGKMKEARTIHSYLLDMRGDITQNQWFKIQVDIAQALRKEGKTDEALDHLDELLKELDNKKYIAYVKNLKGVILAYVDRNEESIELLNSAINSYNAFGIPLLLSLAHNNRGVTNFIMDRKEDAKKDWIKSRRYAKDANSHYGEAIVLPNLADITMREGNFDLAQSYLDRANEIFMDTNDAEGFAIVRFNEAVLSLFKRDQEKALELFRESEEVAFPLPPPQQKKVLRDYFLEVANELGLKEIEDRLQVSPAQ